MELDVLKIFDSWILSKFKSENIRNLLLRHERKSICVTRTCEQIRIAELGRFRHTFSIERYRTVIESVAKMFCDAVLKHAEESAISHAEMMRRIDKANELDQTRQEFEEMEREVLSGKITSRPGAVAN